MASRAISPRRLQSQYSFKKQESGMDSPLHSGRHPLRPIPEASTKSSSTSEQTEPGSPSRPPTPRGKKRAAAVYRQSENVDGNIGSTSNTPEKPREKRTNLTRVAKMTAPWPSKLPITTSLGRSVHEGLQQTDAAIKSWDSDSIGGTPTTSVRTPAITTTGASKAGSIYQTPRTASFSGKPPLDSEPSRSLVSLSNSSFLQSTPSRSVNRSLRYGATPGSVASIGSTRAPVNGKSSGSFQFFTGQQAVAQPFDFEEDPTFWEDHNVQVIIRTRPISTSESAVKGFSRCVRQENSHSITWIGQPETRFTFDHVAGEHITQEKLFRVAGVPMVENCMAGYNSCMFCYGQTGSGKTHTMLGDIVDLEHRPSDDRGITPRVFEYLFSRIQKEEEARTNEHLKYVCKCSFLEIFNEQITDLLEPTSTNLQVREGGKKGVYVENLSEVTVGSVQDVVHLLLLGAANRKVAATNMNRESSRSHSVFTCTIESKWEFNSMTNIRFGRLNLVDLAGSERQKTSGAEGERLKEAANINKSLSTLGLVIMILVDVANGKQRHVPYRDSKLTYLLQDSLGGNSKTTMIANISPSSCCALETLSTLKFAQRAKFIRNNAVVNGDASGDVNGLRQEIQELKEELDRMRRQDLPRTPSMHSISSVDQDSVRKGDYNLGLTVVAVDEQEHSHCSLDSWDFGKAFSGPRFPYKKLEAMEAVLAGALRREQEAELSQQRQAAEIEQLTRLVKQREDDNQCSKMLLRFREDKIARLEALSAGTTSADMYLRQERDWLMNELRLLQEKADRNPELTRFAMENIRLLEQLRRFQDFYTGGEREAMADEISNLRDQLLEVLDSKLSLTALTSPQRAALAPELAAAKREIELLRIEADNYRREVEDCRKNLGSSLEANSRLTKQLDELSIELREVKLECQVHQGDLQKLRDQALDIEAIEWGHAQHVELISNLKIKLKQSEERSERDASTRSEVEGQLNASLQKAADFHAELQETRGALDAAEMIVSRLQSAESSLSVAQEMAALAQNAVRQIHLETKEMAEDQRLSLKLFEDSAVAARMKESELQEELNEAYSLIEKLSSTKDEPKCLRCAAASLNKDEQVQEVVGEKRTVAISQLEQDLKSLDLQFESGCTPPKTSSVGCASEGQEDVAKDCSETPKTQEEQPSDLERSSNCILKLNFSKEDQRADDVSSSETTESDLQAAERIITELQEDQTLSGNYIKSVDLETGRAIRSLLEEIVKLRPQVVLDEQLKAAAKLDASELVKELQSSLLVIQAVQEDSKNWAAQNEALLKEKDMATRACQEWEAATSRLLEHLHEGEHALTDAVREMEGILDDSLSQPTALDRVREREHFNVQQLDMTSPHKTKEKDADQAREEVDNDQVNSIKRSFAVCTTMLSWFSENLTVERTAKDTLMLQNDHAKEELGDKDCLISSLQSDLERATVNLFDNDSLVSELQHELYRDREHVREADAQIAAAVNVQAKLLDEIEKHRLDLTTVSKRMEDTELELAQMQDVLTGLQVELIGCERQREESIAEKEKFAAAFSSNRELLERSCTVTAIMVWWLQNKMAADDEAQKLNYEEFTFQVSERDRMIMNLQEEITEKTTLLKDHMGNDETLINENLEHMQEISNTRNEIAAKDSLLGVMQTNVLRLQEELSASEDRILNLAMENEKLLTQLSESAETSRAIEGVLPRVQRDLKEAEAKVVDLAVAQAGMLIVQEEWGLEKDALERATREAQERCIQLEQELGLARNMSQKFEIELEEAKAQETLLREEKDAAVTNLQEELKRMQISAEAFKDQLELNQRTMAELYSRLQKHLTDWEIEKETTLSAATVAHDQCLEKDQALASVQASHAILQSQLHDACNRETRLSQELEEVLQEMESTQSENEMLKSKAEELFLVVNQQGQEICRQENDFEVKLRKADEEVEYTNCQMKAILVDLDALIQMKEKLEADIESIEQKILHHCLSVEQQLVKVHEDKNQLQDLFAERENELLGDLNRLKSENVSFSSRIQALEDALEDSKVLIKTKEEEMAVLRRDSTDSECKAVQTQEKLRASTLLVKQLSRSEEEWKIQKEALASENKRLTRCMACREMEFSSLQGQKEDLERNLKEAHEKERMTNMTLSNLKENLKVLEKQWQVEREQLKERLVAVNRELVESHELKHAINKALKELEEEVRATEKKSQVTISALETQLNTAKEEMSNHLTEVSQDFLEVKRCAEKTLLDLAKARSLLSAADAAIEQLLENSSVLADSNKQLLEEQEALRLELSHWEQYAVELHRSSCVAPSPFSDDKAIAASEARPLNYYFDLLDEEVERTRLECEILRAEVLDKDSTILSVQMELSCTIASSRQVEIELECVADERSHLKLQLNNINRALANAQDEVRCREVQLEQFEGELHKVMEILVKTEEKMDESARGWRKQIEEVKAEMEAAKLCAIEKGSEVTMLRRQFEQGQTTLHEAELLVNALVRANDSSKLDVLKWKSREENMALQSSEMLSMIEEEVSVTMDRVETQMQVLGSDIHAMRTLLTESCSRIVAGFIHELKEFVGIQMSEIERDVEEAHVKLCKMNAKVIESEQRLHKSVMENETLQITLTNTEELLRVSEAALDDAMQNIESHHNGWAATRDELQGALASLAEKNSCISRSTSECDRLSLRITELEKLFTVSCEELTTNAAKLTEIEMEKLTLAETTDRLQAANNHLQGHVQQLELSVADDIITKQVMEVEIASLRQLKDSYEGEIHKLEADLAVSREAVKTVAAKLLETELTIQALNTDLGNSRNEMMCVQRSLDNAVNEMNDLRQRVHDLEEEEVDLRAQVETQRLVLKSTSDKLVQVEVDSDAAMEILATMLERTSSELYEKQTVIDNLEENRSRFSTVIASLQVAVSQLEQQKEFLSSKANALDDDKKDLLDRLEILSVQLCKQSQEGSAASAGQELQLEILKTIIESASSELQEKDYSISALQEKLEQTSAQYLALDDEKENLLEQLELLGKQFRNQLQEASAASAAHQRELEILTTTIESASIELQEKGHLTSALREKLEESGAQCLALDDEKNSLMEQLQLLGEQLRNQSQEAIALSVAHQMELGILKTTIESASIELQEKDHVISELREKLEETSAQCLALDDGKENLLEQLQLLDEQLRNQSQEASALSVAHQTELGILKTTIESASIELQEKDHVISELREKLEETSAQCLALDDGKENLLEQLQLLGEQLRNQSQEASALSVAHQTELGILKTTIESASIELQEKDHVISELREKLEETSAQCLALDDGKENLLEQLQLLGEQLRNQSQEASALSVAHQMELGILKTTIESASIELQEKDHVISELREKLEESSFHTQKMLNSLEKTDLASAQIEHERDELLKTAHNLEAETRMVKEELEVKSRKCADLEMHISSLQTELQDVSTEICTQKLELEILTVMLESAVKESREKDAMASDLENLLSQSQLQNAEMLQSSQEVVNHFSLFQSQLDACFQQNRDLEKNKLVLTAEVHSQSLEIAEVKEQRQAVEVSLDELRASFAQLKKEKDEEVRVLSDEFEKLKSLEAIMEADLWDWEQRCQDAEVQLDEKDSELEILGGKILATQEECQDQIELMYDELQGCQLRIAEMETERRDLINEIEEGSAIVAEIQEKLQTRESDMEEHFSRHSIEQEALDALENEKRELQSSVKHLTSEVSAHQQRATAAENLQVETRLEMEAIERDLKQKDDLLQSLESDLNLLQESALQELRLNQELESLRATADAVQQELNLQKERRMRLEIEIGQVTEEIVQVKNQAATWKGKAYELETELDKKRQSIESLEDEFRMAEQNMANTLEEASIDLKDVEIDRDRLQVEVLELAEQLEMTQAMVEERDAVASELQQAAELSKALAKEKENEAKLLARSVEELESTVYALESQLGLLKREAERQRLLREDIEMELQRLNNHIFVTQSALEESNARNAEELKDALSALKETERKVEDKDSEISHLRRKLENLEISSRDKDVQINDAMAQISDLLLAAEVQKSDYQQKLKRMESHTGCTIPNSNIIATEVVPSNANSAQEALSQRDQAHVSCESRIKELEEIVSSRQKEVFTLNTRLAEAESMTHDVLRDLLGVKTDMNNVVSMIGQHQIQQLAETARRKNEEVEEMEAELSSLRSQIMTYIEERASWTEEINKRQCEMVAARAAAEKSRQKEQVLTDEIEKFRIENINHQEKIRELETEIMKLPTGQHTFYEQINHHAKIKEENQALKLANENLSKELRRTELLYAGMHDEVKRYREAEIKSTSYSFDEQHHLRHLLQEAEDSRAQAARKLSVLCTAIMQAAGLSDSEQVSSTAAMDALHLLENRLRTTEQELADSKYKVKVTGERRIRRTGIQAKDSPLRSISNFTDLLRGASSPSPAPR